MVKVAVGGTFDVFHDGHKALLKCAIDSGDELLVGLTSDEMAGRTRKSFNPYPLRKRVLEAYLKRNGVRDYRVVPIEEEYGPAVEEELDVLVVSAERRPVTVALNEERKKAGLSPLEIRPVPMVLAEDCIPITSKRIRAGDIDARGRMIRPMRINVGTSNRIKVNAVRKVVSKLYSKVRIKGVPVDSEVPSEPFETKVVEGAINRARSSVKDADFGVGIEAGLFWIEPIKDYVDVQCCVVVDKAGRLTFGQGPGFSYPPKIVAMVKQGMTVGQAMEKLTGIKGMGSKHGAIGYLSDEKVIREEITRVAVFMAFLPRLKRDLYFSE